jgi:hypothetical protein
VRLIYLDPPFATKQEFRGTQDEKAYQDKLAGAVFIEFLRKRLILLRELLADDGTIFLHMDWRKVHYIKVVMDEVFGEHNFRNEIILPGRASKNLQQQFETVSRLNVRHDSLLWYSKKTGTRFAKQWIEKHDAGNPEGHWHHFWSNADRPTMRYRLFGSTPRSGQWTWKEERAKKAVANYQRFTKESGGRTLAEYWRDTGSRLDFIRPDPDDGKPQYWRPPAEQRLADTVWAGIPIYDNKTGYPTEKNEALLVQILGLASKTGDLVLDAFVGSGTTAVVAERLERRWLAIDSGKLAIYTVQKRLLTLGGQQGRKRTGRDKAAAYTLYNAGLYDLSRLRHLDWSAWRFFALQLFQCRDEPHVIGGISLDGYLKGASVLVFDYKKHLEARLDEDSIASIHHAIGSRIGSKFFIIAPSSTFDFQQDFLQLDDVRYYALRIPYSIIHELHQRDFSALRQPVDIEAVNDTVDAVGFDFIRTPRVSYEVGIDEQAANLDRAFIRLTAFQSDVVATDSSQRVTGRESLAMVMLDFDYNPDVFAIDAFFFADQLKKDNWTITFPRAATGSQIMAIFVDIYGNEATESIPPLLFSTKALRKTPGVSGATRTKNIRKPVAKRRG